MIDTCLLYGLNTDYQIKNTYDLLKKLIKFDSESAKIVLKQTLYLQNSNNNHVNNNHLWLQISIMNKLLIGIIECIITNCEEFYSSYSLVSNPFDSQIFHSLLAGLNVIKFNPKRQISEQILSRLASSSPAINNSNKNVFMSPITNHSKRFEYSFISPIYNYNNNNNYSQSSLMNNSASLNNNNSAKKKEKIRRVCFNVEKQIKSKIFLKWLEYHRKNKVIKRNLVNLMKLPTEQNIEIDFNRVNKKLNEYLENNQRLDETLWNILQISGEFDQKLFFKLVYKNGIRTNGENHSIDPDKYSHKIDNTLRKKVWPYLLNHFNFAMTLNEIEEKRNASKENYERLMNEWKPFEQYKRIVDEINLNQTLNVSLDIKFCPFF